MIVRMTDRQMSALLRYIEDVERGELMARWLGEEASTASGRRVDLLMPAVAWSQLEVALFDTCYDERGFRRRKVPAMLQRVHRSIRAGLNARSVHPALFGEGGVGLISEFIPAWKFPGPDASGKRYSPTPVFSMPFTVLAPQFAKRSKLDVTVWAEATSIPPWPILQERSHTEFIP